MLHSMCCLFTITSYNVYVVRQSIDVQVSGMKCAVAESRM